MTTALDFRSSDRLIYLRKLSGLAFEELRKKGNQLGHWANWLNGVSRQPLPTKLSRSVVSELEGLGPWTIVLKDYLEESGWAGLVLEYAFDFGPEKDALWLCVRDAAGDGEEWDEPYYASETSLINLTVLMRNVARSLRDCPLFKET